MIYRVGNGWSKMKIVTLSDTGGNPAECLAKMTANLRAGMVMDISLWGVSNAGMSWLDGPTGCKGDCNITNSRAVFSDGPSVAITPILAN